MNALRLTYVGIAWLFLGCVVVQVFLAGLGVFVGPQQFELHRGFGYTFGWLTLILLVVAIAGRLGRRWIGLAALLLFLFAMQSVFVALRPGMPAVAALHPVNALAIFGVAFHLATRSRVLVRRGATVPAAPAVEVTRA
ncbi:MAG TPA: DUF6220 domain-containing protein [Kofleriaceae bacterium]|jgi:hypothetical protein|nr:DUF6220 domain-containing protein [Kofleriaceae bacterium]